MFKIETSKEVDKFLDKHRDIAKKYVSNLEILKISPFSNNLDIKPLKWHKNHFRLRI
jgi:mRNA interferase RelE/StbE